MEFTVRPAGGAVVGEDTGGDGAAVVLLHPGWGDSTIWNGVAARLPRSARVIRYDERGYGRSPAPTESFTSVNDLIAVLDHLSVADVIAAGHSGGGGAAVSLALAQPERVRSLILMAPGIGDYPWPTGDPYFGEFQSLFESGDTKGSLRSD